MTVDLRRRYRRIGTMTYEVTAPDGTALGTVWRTRTGWSARDLDGILTTEDYPGSRDTAAGTLRTMTADQQAALDAALPTDPFAGLSDHF